MTVVEARKELSLIELATELQRQADSKVDVVADTRRMEFVSSTDETRSSEISVDVLGGDMIEARVNDHCHAQIADRIGVPKKYYDRMRIDAPGLLDRNVNHWLTEKPESRMVRILDGNARAFLSNRYRRLDNIDLMEHALPVFNEIEGVEFHVGALTETKMYVRALLPRLQAEVKVGDIVQAGCAISNSEVGAGSLVVEPFLYRLVCLNGMTVPAYRMRKFHTGKKVEDTEEMLSIYRDETLAADDNAFFMKVADLIRASLSEAQFAEIVESLREAADSTEMVRPAEATVVLAQRLDLGDGEADSVLAHLIRGGDLTQWGAANAVTRAARDVESFDRRVQLEDLGGCVATMSADEWSRIAVAV